MSEIPSPSDEMSRKEPLGTGVRTAEQDATVRRIGLPIGIAGAICGIVSLAMLIADSASAFHPPALLAVNLSFCAMMMGIGILFYVRKTKGTGIATGASLVAILAGLAGPVVFAKISLDYRVKEQTQELANVSAIAAAANKYAVAHGGVYPADLAVMVEEKLIPVQTLHSPYERVTLGDDTVPPNLSHEDLVKFLDEHTDYQYFSFGLRVPGSGTATEPATEPTRAQADLFAKVIVASRHWAIERRDISIAYMDGRAEMVSGEDVQGLFDASNQARKTLGFQAVPDPEVVEHRTDEK